MGWRVGYSVGKEIGNDGEMNVTKMCYVYVKEWTSERLKFIS